MCLSFFASLVPPLRQFSSSGTGWNRAVQSVLTGVLGNCGCTYLLTWNLLPPGPALSILLPFYVALKHSPLLLLLLSNLMTLCDYESFAVPLTQFSLYSPTE